MLAGGTPGPDFSLDPTWSTQPHYEGLLPFFANNNVNANVAGPSRQRRVRFASPNPGPVRVQITDPTPTIPLALRRQLAARRTSGAQGPVWATQDGQVLIGADGSPAQPHPEEITRIQTPGLGPNGTEQFDDHGKRVFVEKEIVQRGTYWYSPISGGLQTVQEE